MSTSHWLSPATLGSATAEMTKDSSDRVSPHGEAEVLAFFSGRETLKAQVRTLLRGDLGDLIDRTRP